MIVPDKQGSVRDKSCHLERIQELGCYSVIGSASNSPHQKTQELADRAMHSKIQENFNTEEKDDGNVTQ